jgi:hypothetical protein
MDNQLAKHCNSLETRRACNVGNEMVLQITWFGLWKNKGYVVQRKYPMAKT